MGRKHIWSGRLDGIGKKGPYLNCSLSFSSLQETMFWSGSGGGTLELISSLIWYLLTRTNFVAM